MLFSTFLVNLLSARLLNSFQSLKLFYNYSIILYFSLLTGLGEKPYPFKAPSPQDMVALRKAIEKGCINLVRDRVWDNPRYLISSGNSPAILQVMLCTHIKLYSCKLQKNFKWKYNIFLLHYIHSQNLYLLTLFWRAVTEIQ